MNLKRFIGQKLHFFLIALLVFLSLSALGVKAVSLIRERSNQKAISQTLSFLDSHPKADSIPALNQLLTLKSLTYKQKADIYNKLSVDLYLQNRIEEFLQVSGKAIFYNESAGNIEKAVYQYALLSQYYLEFGADNSGFETILTGRRLKNFYKIEDPVIRSQALHSYARFLVSESDFEDAYKAENQMEEDAALIMKTSKEFGIDFLRRALAFKAYIMMMQGKTEEAHTLANDLYAKYYRIEAEPSHVTVYNFLLPLFWVQTQWAIRTHQFDKAIAYNKEYRSAARKYHFLMKAVSLTKDIMFALPDDMVLEWDSLYELLAADTDELAQIFLENYTSQTGARLTSEIETLVYTADRTQIRQHLFSSLYVFVLILIVFSLILLFVYSETQIDGLTKLRNRRSLNIRLGKLASNGKRYSAIMIDIDNFKHLNDTFGHDFGDEVLKGVAQLLIDTETRDVKCYRYGGEEMVIILEHFDLEHAIKLSEHVRTEIAQMKWRNDVHVTASFGLGFEMPDSVKEADENMYVAKQKGKNFTAYKKDGKQYLAERRLDIRNPVPDVP